MRYDILQAKMLKQVQHDNIVCLSARPIWRADLRTDDTKLVRIANGTRQLSRQAFCRVSVSVEQIQDRANMMFGKRFVCIQHYILSRI